MAELPPGDGDWVIGLKGERETLRERYPDARFIPTFLSGQLRGQTLKGRVFVTSIALRKIDLDAVTYMASVCAMTTGGDPTIRVLS